MLYETSKLNKVQLCMECLHLCKQHIPTYQTVNNTMWLDFSFLFHFEVSCTHKPLSYLYNEGEYDLVASKSCY